MIHGTTVSVVIPCHNEVNGLRRLLPATPVEIDEVLVVDNNCLDDTAAVAEQLGARVVRETTPGYGSALQAGIRAVSTDVVVTMDGDGQYDITEVPQLVRRLLERNLDVLVTNRFPLQHGAMPPLRQGGNFLLTAVVWLLFGRVLNDTQSGMWVFWRRHMPVIGAKECGMAYSEEFKLRAVRAGLRVDEARIRYLPRVGRSKLAPFGDGWQNLLYLFRLRFRALP